VRFRLRTAGGKELIAPVTVTQSRDISYNETSALAKENEQNLLYRDMTSDIGNQIVRRIGAVKSL
jgi:LPS-assembly lipoprotein